MVVGCLTTQQWVMQSVSVPTLRDGCLSAMSRCPVIFFFPHFEWLTGTKARGW